MGIMGHKPEEIVTKLRQVEVLVGQGMARICNSHLNPYLSSSLSFFWSSKAEYVQECVDRNSGDSNSN